ncbi:hypothetical protein ACFL6X_03900 [Candidatus Latescibacterota bacterium]
MDESFRRILPYFQPGNDNPWIYPWLVELVAIVALVALAALLMGLLIRRRRWQRLVWGEFRSAAAERGLSEEQTSLAGRIARDARMRHPLSLLTSAEFFNRRLNDHLKRLPEGQPRQAEIDSLTHIRVLLGFDVVPSGRPLGSTRQLSTGQRLMVWPAKGGPPGFCHAVVVHRDDDAIVAVPLLRADDAALSRLEAGDRIKVRFWRHHDTEYRFRSSVLESDPDTTCITIAHSDRLERIQKRDFYRLPVGFHLGLIVLQEEKMGDADAIASGRRIDVAATDISGGGLGVTSSAAVPPGSVVVVDPSYSGIFPIAGLWCQVAGQERRHQKRWVRLEFADISRERREDLVSVIQRQHIHRVGV